MRFVYIVFCVIGWCWTGVASLILVLLWWSGRGTDGSVSDIRGKDGSGNQAPPPEPVDRLET